MSEQNREKLDFDAWYVWFTTMLGRKPDAAEKNAIRYLVEEAKREEGERMINWLNGYCDRHEQPYNGHCYEGKRIAKRKDCYECWQALVKK